MTDLTRTDASPFEAIKQVRPDGSEFWSARGLMPLLGYGADWRNFAAAVDRAKESAKVQGEDVTRLFVGVTEKSGGRPREDFELARDGKVLAIGDDNRIVFFDRNDLAVFIAALLGVEADNQ